MKFTHCLALCAAAGLTCQGAFAQTQQARVLSAVPVVQQVATPQQVCGTQEVYSGQRTTGTGAVIGAVIGGVAGSALGMGGGHHGRHGYYGGPSRTATAAIGAIAGGLIGNQVEGSNGGTPAYQNVRRCENETVYENRTVGYDVTYEYAGQRYTTRMDQDPGQWMPVQVQPHQGNYGSNTYSNGAYSNGSTSGFVGPSGSYTSAPPGVPVIQSITYSSPQPVVPVLVDVGPGYAPPPPPPGYWRRY